MNIREFSAANPEPSVEWRLATIPGLVWAFRFRANGCADALPVDLPIGSKHEGWLWLHFNLADVRARQWLGSLPGIPLSASALLLASEDFQQLHISEDCIYGIFSDLVRNFDCATEEIGHLHFVMTESLMISGRRSKLSAIEETRKALEAGLRMPSVATLLETIIEHTADTIDGMIDGFSVELDRIEDRILSDTMRDDRRKLGQLRRTTVRFHRQLSELRAILHRLERQNVEGLKPTLRVTAAKLAQRLDGLDHEVISLRERSRLLQEETAAKLAEETNRHLHVLSILTALFLPPTLISGLFGMNTKGLPFSENENGFWWAFALAAIASIAVYWIMRRLGILESKSQR